MFNDISMRNQIFNIFVKVKKSIYDTDTERFVSVITPSDKMTSQNHFS